MSEIYYYLYQITCLLDNRIYVGVHKTSKLDDGYMGSGKYLKASIKTHGIENFEKKILQFFDNEEDMYNQEAIIVTSEFIRREDTYNLSEGGKPVGISIRRQNGAYTGRVTTINGTGLHSKDSLEKAKIKSKEWRKNHAKEATDILKKASVASRLPEVKEKRRKTFAEISHQQGEKNSQFGTLWITDGAQNKKIQSADPLPPGWRKGRVLKKER